MEAEDDDDPSSLQLSWEMLELAKQCLKKQADALPADDPKRPEVEGRLSETFMKLGEVSIGELLVPILVWAQFMALKPDLFQHAMFSPFQRTRTTLRLSRI